MFLEQAAEVKIHDILRNPFNESLNDVTDDFMEGIKDNMGTEVKCTEKQVRFISDLHFGHGDIIAYDNRLFRDIKHMWYSIRDAWNSVVKKDDTVYILGDVVWYKDARKAETLLNQLNGEKHLIKGNHDHRWLDERSKKCFKSINDYAEINVDDHNIVLSHYPMFSWKNMYGSSQNRTGAWIHLYGHVHMTKEFTLYIDCLESMNGVGFKPYSAFNVGAMCPWINYVPRTLEEIERGYKRWKDSCK